MLIVYWPVTIKFRTREQTSKPQTNYRCCLRVSYLAPYWFISRNTITFHKYFWCSRLCEFHSKTQGRVNRNVIGGVGRQSTTVQLTTVNYCRTAKLREEVLPK